MHPYYIKRIIGMPGETVQIKDGKVYINDKELKSDVYGITDYIDYPGIAEEPVTLGKDEYFCLGIIVRSVRIAVMRLLAP